MTGTNEAIGVLVVAGSTLLGFVAVFAGLAWRLGKLVSQLQGATDSTVSAVSGLSERIKDLEEITRQHEHILTVLTTEHKHHHHSSTSRSMLEQK